MPRELFCYFTYTHRVKQMELSHLTDHYYIKLSWKNAKQPIGIFNQQSHWYKSIERPPNVKLGLNWEQKSSIPPSPTGQIWLWSCTKLTSTWPLWNVKFFSQHTAVALPSSISSHRSDEKTIRQIRANRKKRSSFWSRTLNKNLKRTPIDVAFHL